MLDFIRENRDAVYVIYAGAALGAFLLFTGLAQVLSRRESTGEAKNRRMRLIAKGASTGELLALLKPTRKRGILNRLPFVGDLPGQLLKAGLTVNPFQVVALALVATLIITVGGLRFFDPLQALGLGVLVGICAPLVALHFKRKHRIDQLTSQLPDALDLMARGLKVGHPLNTSIGSVAQEMEDPIATEFGVIFDQISYGDDLVDAFREFAERVDIEDVHYLSASIGIQHGTGGDLGRIIQVLSQVVRNRIMMRKRILAISAEGRLSANFLSALPIGIYAMTMTSNPDYYVGVSEDPLYMPLAIAVVFFSVANYLLMRKLVNFRI